MKPEKLFCFGHRGARGREPENTVRSVRRALELGADGIEVDVYCVDGRLVVIHDGTLNRTTNGIGPVLEKTFTQLRSLDAGRGEKIPTLEEIFDAVNRRALINVELKGPRTAAPVVALIDEYVRSRGWRYEDFLVSSFDHALLEEAKKLRPEIRLGALFEEPSSDLAAEAERLGAWSLHVSRTLATPELVAAAHRLGLKIFVFTVNEPDQLDRLKALGVDGVFTDYPDRVVGTQPRC